LKKLEVGELVISSQPLNQVKADLKTNSAPYMNMNRLAQRSSYNLLCQPDDISGLSPFGCVYLHLYERSTWGRHGDIVEVESAIWETWVQYLGWEDPLEKGMAIHSSIFAWRIPWREAPVCGIAKNRIRLRN